MPNERPPIEISVEQELAGSHPDRPLRVRLVTRLEAPAEGPLPPERIRAAIDELRSGLVAAIGEEATGPAPHPDRPLAELIGTYRPRQRELVELLHEEGELNEAEYTALREYLDSLGSTGGTSSALPVTRTPVAEPERPFPAPPPASLAAAPIAQERPGPAAMRPVPELLEQYQISSLKQAGAVRARRQISFEEYMALKRHFAQPASPTTA